MKLIVMSILLGFSINTYASSGEAGFKVCKKNRDNIFGFAKGNGTKKSPFVICNERHLNKIRERLSSGSYYALGRNINLEYSDFAPLGDRKNNFIGNFDGNNFSIKNWSFYKPGQNDVGFFGYVRGDTKIINLALKNIDLVAGQSVGGLIGIAEGGVNTKLRIENVLVRGHIQAENFVGGLIGRKENNHSQFYVFDSSFFGSVIATGETGYAGGVMGYTSVDIGGLFFNLYSKGRVQGTRNVGGLFGYISKDKRVVDSHSDSRVIIIE